MKKMNRQDSNASVFCFEQKQQSTLRRADKRKLRWVGLTLIAFVLSACSSTPVELSDPELEQRTAQTLDDLFDKYPQVQQKVSLGEAMARALLFNLDDRVQLLKIAVEQKAKNVERLDLLPKLTLDAGYSSFSENLASFNKNTVTEIRSTQPTISSEDESVQANLSLAWNILDFGVSYVRSQQQADRILIAEARRQQTMQNVLTDVRAAFWRAYAAQQWEQPVEKLLADLEIGLENSRRAGESGAVTKEEALRVQSGLLETLGDLLTIKKRLAGAKNELAGLMNLRPGEPFQVTLDKNVKNQIDKERRNGFKILELNDEQVTSLEETALITRPELLIADYNVRIMQKDIKRLMFSMLPGVDLSLGGYYDGNDFKRYDQYTRLGLNVGYDLFNLMKWPAHKQQAKNKVLLEEEKRKALAMAVLTQLHVALAQRGLTQRQLRFADRLERVDGKLLFAEIIGYLVKEMDLSSSSLSAAEEIVRQRGIEIIKNFYPNTISDTNDDRMIKRFEDYVEDYFAKLRDRSGDQQEDPASNSYSGDLVMKNAGSARGVLQARLSHIESGLTLDWMFSERQRTVDQLYIASGVSLAEPLPSSVIQQQNLAVKLAEVTRAMSARTNRLQDPDSVMAAHAAGRIPEPVVAKPAPTNKKVSKAAKPKEALKAAKKQPAKVAKKAEVPKDISGKKVSKQQTRAAVERAVKSTPKATASAPLKEAPRVVSKQTQAKPKVKEKAKPVGKPRVAKVPVQDQSPIKSTRYAESKDWCVHVAYFAVKSNAERYIARLENKSSTRLVAEFNGQGYVIHSEPLSYNNAYEFRAEAKSSFAKDAYIRKCQ